MSASHGVGPTGLTVVKGHGTENDFVLVVDLEGTVDLNPALVRALCDRRAGVGGDGVLRVVRTERIVGGDSVAPGTEFFMDYRNADGSMAEMCGNGLRVFVRYLAEAGLVAGAESIIGTRAGSLPTSIAADGTITVVLGRPTWPQHPATVSAAGLNGPRAATTVAVPNPHVVVELESPAELEAVELIRAPVVEPAMPEGQNVEFVVRTGQRSVRMRVHERGVGETRSCGTGIAAVVAALARADAAEIPDGARAASGSPLAAVGDGQIWQVDVPGGTCTVRWRADGHLELAGPAVIVGAVELDSDWLAAASAA